MQETTKPQPLNTDIFRDVFDASPIGIAVENFEGQPLFANRALCSMLGFSEDEMRGKHCVQFSPPEDASRDWALFQQLQSGSIDHYQIEKRYFRRDGSLMWGQLSISLLNTHPSPLVVAMVEDITEKKKAEEARFRHSAIVESSQDAIASATLDGVITSWNPGAERIFGYTESEAVGNSVSILLPPEAANEEEKILETLRNGGRIDQFETVRLTKTGKRINVSLSISPIKDSSGKIVGCSGIAHDITQRKLAEDKLREYERAVEGSEEMIAVIDRELRYLIANRKFLKMRSMTREQVVGHYAHEVLNKDFFEAVVKEKLEECFQGKVVRYETKYSYPEVGEREILVSYFPIEGASGVDRLACILHDITDRKQLERALTHMSRQLIESQEHERSRIGRELHDDINQKLSMLALELEQLQENPSELQSRVQELRKRMAGLSSDVQALAHDLHSSKLEYLGVAAGIKSWCREFSERHRMEIDFSSDVSSVLPIEVGLPLFRIVQEALQNAMKHSGVRRAAVQLREHAQEIHLVVSDKGRGFDIEGSAQGRGLGLTSMRERVRLANGTITIDSRPMGGTSIEVRLPLGSTFGLQQEAV